MSIIYKSSFTARPQLCFRIFFWYSSERNSSASVKLKLATILVYVHRAWFPNESRSSPKAS